MTRICVALLCTTEVTAERHCLCATHYRFVPFALLEPVLRAFNHYATLDEQGPAFHSAVASMNAWIRADGETSEGGRRRSWEGTVRETRARDEARRARAAAAATARDEVLAGVRLATPSAEARARAMWGDGDGEMPPLVPMPIDEVVDAPDVPDPDDENVCHCGTEREPGYPCDTCGATQ